MSNPVGPQWEYAWNRATDIDVDTALNTLMDEVQPLGDEGWELVNFTLQYTGNGFWTAVGVLKRQRP